jgi:hypothetical protein
LPLSPLEINECWYSVTCLYYTLHVGIHILIFFLAHLAKGNVGFGELPVVAMFVNRSGQNEHSLEGTFHRCFLPSVSSFGWEVSEEKIKMWKVNGRRKTDAGNSRFWLADI